MKHLKMSVASLLFFTFISCQKSSSIENDTQEEKLIAARSNAASAALARPQSWADCLLFDGVVTPANFKPESDPFDELYMNNLGVGFKDGKPLISESKPGDRDYNGGRWHLNVIKPSVDPAKYKYACKFEDLDPADFMSTPTYFECPLLPRK
jgi:hypothetical protein